VVTIAVLLIIITAPLGAVGISLSAPRLLQKDDGGASAADTEQNSNGISHKDEALEMGELNPGETLRMIDDQET
jgi:hypothetical protein